MLAPIPAPTLPQLTIQHRVHPWPHIVIDNFLPLSELRRIQKDLLAGDHTFKVLPDDPEEIQFTALPDLPLTRHLLSKEVLQLLETLSGESLRIYQKGAVQLRRMTPHSPEFPPHVDFIDAKALVMLLYLSPGWNKSCGGELVLQKNETFDPCTDQYLAPLENRMVLFFNDTQHWHAVRKVHDWNRFLVMAEWIVQ